MLICLTFVQNLRPVPITKRDAHHRRVRGDTHSARPAGPTGTLHREGAQHVYSTLCSHLHAGTGANIGQYKVFVI